MKRFMWLQLLPLVAVPRAFAQRPGQEDPLVLNLVAPGEVECGCKCCEVVERLPAEVVTLPAGQGTLAHKCSMPQRAEADESVIPNCPHTCTTSQGTIDFDRFCNHDCQPSTATVGTECIANHLEQMRESDANWGAAEGSRIGQREQTQQESQNVVKSQQQSSAPAAISPPSVAASVADDTELEEADQAKYLKEHPEIAADWEADLKRDRARRVTEEAVAAAIAEEGPNAKRQEVIVDLRRLKVGRLRAEAGAAATNAAASGDQVMADARVVKRDAALLSKLRGTVPAAEGALAISNAATEANSSAAHEAALGTLAALKQAEVDAPRLLGGVKDLAAREIRRQAASAATAMARAYARKVAWDKPASYSRVVAYRAGEPYAEQAAIATGRISEYEGVAADRQREADAAEAEANEIIPQVVTMENQGGGFDTGEREHANSLFRKARKFEAEAAEARTSATYARESANAWWSASADAVATAATNYFYAHATTQPPTLAAA